MGIGGVIFDVDGLMADSEPLHRAAWRSSAAAAGFLPSRGMTRRASASA